MFSEEQPASFIFEGYKGLGMVTNDKPFLIRYIDKYEDLRIVTCIGKYFYVFNSKLSMLEASHAHKNDISVMASDNKNIFTGSSSEIFIWKNGHKKLIAKLNYHTSKIKFLLPIGLQLISVDDESLVCITDLKSKELVGQIPFHNHLFKITSILHPSTYINKILLASEQGSMQLYNIRKFKTIYTFKGWNKKINCLVQSPAIDVVAVGLENGLIYIHNLKMDETIMKFEQEWGEILNLSFRTDGVPYLVSSSKLGHVAIWDLENRRLHKQMRDVHKGPVTGCEFVRNEALLVTSSSDNKLKVWRFDELNDNGVILHLREGHSLPPTKIRFYSESGHQIISSSLDCTLRNFSIYSERLHKNLGTATTNRKLAKRLGSDKDPYKLSPITDFAFETIREKEFDNIATIHKKTLESISWSGDKCRIGSNKFVHKRFKNVYGIEATAITMSSCGNFVCIGYTSGHIDKFNIQSGLHRNTFITDDHVQRSLQFDSENKITGLVIDDISTILISTNSSFIKFWNFKTSKLIHQLNLKKVIKNIHINRQTGLIAVSFETDEINIIDLDTKNLIREFKDLDSKINDIVFSTDSKWIIVAFEDKSIRVFDLESAAKIDHFLLSSPCLSLSISPNNEFLATSHPDQNGIFLWSNITLYVPKLLHKLKSDYQPKLLDLPVARPDEIVDDEDLEDGHTEIYNENSKLESNEKDFIHYKSPEQLSKELITLSNLPSSRWKNLTNLDLIKKRNKPIAPVEKPKNAPFFLPIVAGLNPKFDFGLEEKSEEITSKKRIVNQLVAFTEFGQILYECGTNDKDYDSVLKKLSMLGPSSIDAEIRSLDSLPPSSCGLKINQPILLLFFLEAIDQLLDKNLNFELINSYLALFLKIHGDLIIKYPNFSKKAKSILEKLESSWNKIDNLFSENICVLNYIRSVVL